jgi:hypothetical protein
MIAVAKVSLPLGRRLPGYGLAAAAVVAVTPVVSLLARNAMNSRIRGSGSRVADELRPRPQAGGLPGDKA